MKLFIVGLVIAINSCAQVETHFDKEPNAKRENKTYGLDEIDISPELLSTVKAFIGDLIYYKKEFQIDFKSIKLVDKLDKNFIGVCYYNDRIEILKRNIAEIRTRLVIYHELGHCILKLDHTEPDTNTIMQPVEMSDNYYIREHWDELVKQEMNQLPALRFDVKTMDYYK